MTQAGILWVARVRNPKTGDVPTAYVGLTKDEARASCKGCRRLDRGCYAWGGWTNGRHTMILKRLREGRATYTIDEALAGRAPTARIVRLSALGDPARAGAGLFRDMILVLQAGLRIVGYTHFWREKTAKWLHPVLMASCETPEEADEAAYAGWAPAVVLPADHQGKTFTTPGGLRGVACPAQSMPGSTTCNDCQLCSPAHRAWDTPALGAIGFVEHGRTLLLPLASEALGGADAAGTLSPPRRPGQGLAADTTAGRPIPLVGRRPAATPNA